MSAQSQQMYPVCNKKVQLQYPMSNCQVKCHINCINADRNEMVSDVWYCPYSVQSMFPYNHFDDDDAPPLWPNHGHHGHNLIVAMVRPRQAACIYA